MKHNQLSKLCFVRSVTLKTRKFDDFREFYENGQEMVAPGVETNKGICDVIFGELIFTLVETS